MMKAEAEGGGSGGTGRRPRHTRVEWVVELKEVEPWPEPVDGKALLDEIAATLPRFVVLGKWVIEAVCLWVVHSYAFELRDVTTYLGIESPQPRCGKSTLLDVLERLVNRALRAANISPSAFFRAIAETDPTLLIDEGDTFLHTDELKGILNSGYQRGGAYVMRVSNEAISSGAAGGEGEASGQGAGTNGGAGVPSRLVRYSCWCPKAIARIGRLPQTLADRCIVFVMQRKLPSERCERLKNLNGETLRRKCARFVLDNAEAIRRAQPKVPEELNDRAADIWEPLLAVADLAGGDWPERARRAAVGLSARAQEADPMGSFLMDIFEYFVRSGKDRIFTRVLTEWLKLSEDRPWMALMKGKAVTGRWVAQQLQGYGIRPKTMRIGEERAKGYEKQDFLEAFRRYIPKSEVEAFKAGIREQAEANTEISHEGNQGNEEDDGASDGTEKRP